LRKINGIEFANNGIKIGVHRNGSVAFIRFGGAIVSSTRSGGIETPSGKGFQFERLLSTEQIDVAFSSEAPTSKVHWKKFMYALPDDVTSGVLEPMEIFAHSVQSSSQGETSMSRRLHWGYRVGATGGRVDLSPRPEPSATGDPRTSP